MDKWATCPECDYCIARNGSAKCFFVIHNVNWVEAKDFCASYGGQLATVRSDLETRYLNRTKCNFSFLKYFFNKVNTIAILGIGFTNAWIGLRWKHSANSWLWVDDVPITSWDDYTAFAPGEPGETWASCVEFIARDIYYNYLGYYVRQLQFKI